MADDAPEAPAQPIDPAPPPAPPLVVTQNVPIEGAPTAPTSGRRPSFRDIRRQLTEEELKQPGVQKLLIEDFERAEMECETLRSFVEKYHEADKQVGILRERSKVDKALEIATSIGLVGGGAIFSLAPSFWAVNTFQGVAAIVIGLLFVGGAIAAKAAQRAK
jgi:hypothetical protein